MRRQHANNRTPPLLQKSWKMNTVEKLKQQTDAQTAPSISRNCWWWRQRERRRWRVGSEARWPEVRRVRASRIVPLGPEQRWLGITKLWNLSLRENIWREALYVSHSTRERDAHRRRWWINAGGEAVQRIQAGSSCLDLTSPDGLCKTAQDGEEPIERVCVGVCVAVGSCDTHRAEEKILGISF